MRTSRHLLTLAVALGACLTAAADDVAPPDSDVEVTVRRGDPGAPVSVQGEVSSPQGDFEDVVRYRVDGIPAGVPHTVLRVSIKCTGTLTGGVQVFSTAGNKSGCNGNAGRVFEQVLNANSNPTGTIRIRAPKATTSRPAHVKWSLTFTASPHRPN